MDTNKFAEKCMSIKKSLKKHALMKAIFQLTSLAEEEPKMFANVYDQLTDLKENYLRMQQFLSCGMADEHAQTYFIAYIDEAYSILQDVRLEQLISENSVYKACHKRSTSIQRLDIQYKLEKIAMDESIFSMEQEMEPTDKKTEMLNMRKAAAEYRNKLFSYLLVSPQWKQTEREEMTQLITSPKVDEISAQMMVSAIMLSCLTLFDMQKFRALLEIYKLSDNIKIKEKALIGWVLASITDDFYKEKITHSFKEECVQDPHLLKELVEMQKQLIIGCETKKNSVLVEKTLKQKAGKLYELAKKAKKKDQYDSSLDEILHPEKEEELLNNLNDYVEQVIDMEKEGYDIYYHEFSHMKSLAFFHSLANWFTPFYYENPVLEESLELGDKEKAFLRFVVETSPLSDDDAYSFVLSILHVMKMNAIPNMFLGNNSKVIKSPLESMTPEQVTFCYRKLFLRDLYRFFTLSSVNSFAPKIFEIQKEGIPIVDFMYHINCDENIYGKAVKSVCRFLFKRGDYEKLSVFLQSSQTHDDEYDMLVATSCFKLQKNIPQAIFYMERLIQKYPDNLALISMLLPCYELENKHKKIIALFEQSDLWNSLASDLSIYLPKALYAVGREKEAINKLYELYYKNPEDLDVLKTLNFFLFATRAFEKAHQIYEKLEETEAAKLEEGPFVEYKITEALYQLSLKNESGALHEILLGFKLCERELFEKRLDDLILKIEEYAQIIMPSSALFMVHLFEERTYQYIYENSDKVIIKRK